MKTLIDISPEKTGNTFRSIEIFPKIKDANVLKAIHLSVYRRKTTEIASVYEKIDLLKKHYPDACILYVTRNKDKWLRSLYKHWVREGGSLGFKDWHNHVMDKETVRDMDNHVKYIKEVFPDCYIMQFEVFIVKPMDCINDMLCHFGLNPISFRNKKHNVGLNDKQVKLCRNLNRLFNKHASGRNWVELINKPNGGKR